VLFKNILEPLASLSNGKCVEGVAASAGARETCRGGKFEFRTNDQLHLCRGLQPQPPSVTLCGLPGPLSVIETAAESPPTSFGL